MVVGLDKFSEHFADFNDHYVLIGGAAAWLILTGAGLTPRATKDLDIVLCIEVLDKEFANAFWSFLQKGGYEIQERSQGQKNYYRFRKPTVEGYPVILELFSRKPDTLILGGNSHLTPIPVGEDVSSLSAILLEDSYYEFLHEHKRDSDGISIVTEKCLIPLKAKAWLDLTERKAGGEQVDGNDIKKHLNDVLRLYQLLEPDNQIVLPISVRADLERFLVGIEAQVTAAQLKNLGIKGVDPAQIITAIRNIYGITVR